ncbi:hypothetical protein ACET81_20740 [Aeromonas veronii]
MKVIKKGFYEATKGGYVRSLEERERHLLSDTWTPSSDPYTRQQSLLLQMREQQHWLLCDCQSSSPVVMYPRRYPSGVIGLVNHPDHHAHEEHCPFWKVTNPDAEKEGRKLRRVKQRLDFCFHQRINADPSEPEEKDKEPSKNKKKPGDPGLVKLIYLLLAISRLDRFDGENRYNQSLAIERIRKAAVNLTVDKLFTVADVLYTNINEINNAVRTLQTTKSKWSRRARPHAIFIVMFDKHEYVGKQLKIQWFKKNGKEWEKSEYIFPSHMKVVMPGRVNVAEGGPYIMAFTLADPEGKEDFPFFSPCKGAIVPILTKEHPMPVDSRFERETFKALRTLARKELECQRSITVIKPLSDLVAPLSGEPCRPDVVIEFGVRKIIVEVMGSYSDDYKLSKAITLPRMREIAPVIEFDALGADLDGQLTAEAMKVCRQAVAQLIQEISESTANEPDPMG